MARSGKVECSSALYYIRLIQFFLLSSTVIMSSTLGYIGKSKFFTAVENISDSTAGSITASVTLNAVSDHGKIFAVDTSGGNITITLPTVQAGLFYRFLLTDATNTATIAAPDANSLQGTLIEAVLPLAIDGDTSVQFLATNTIGDWAEFRGIDSTNWFVNVFADTVNTVLA